MQVNWAKIQIGLLLRLLQFRMGFCLFLFLKRLEVEPSHTRLYQRLSSKPFKWLDSGAHEDWYFQENFWFLIYGNNFVHAKLSFALPINFAYMKIRQCKKMYAYSNGWLFSKLYAKSRRTSWARFDLEISKIILSHPMLHWRCCSGVGMIGWQIVH